MIVKRSGTIKRISTSNFPILAKKNTMIPKQEKEQSNGEKFSTKSKNSKSDNSSFISDSDCKSSLDDDSK
jgi:hypothetical protein